MISFALQKMKSGKARWNPKCTHFGWKKNPTNLPNQRFGVGTRNLGVRSTLRCSAANPPSALADWRTRPTCQIKDLELVPGTLAFAAPCAARQHHAVISYSWINRFQRWYSRIFHPPRGGFNWKNLALGEVFSGGNTRIWTGESEFCRLVPYPLAMLPYSLLKKGS